jgi:hypothetical protein
MWYASCVLFQETELAQRGEERHGPPMTSIDAPIIRCPVCQSDGAMLHHDLRATLVYSCQNCMHEWQIDVAEEPPQEDPTVERPRTASARSQPLGKR